MARRNTSSPTPEEPFGLNGSPVQEGWIDVAASQAARHASLARESSGRKRLVDPTTCDRDYTSAELEFMLAMQEYKKDSGRMYPTWSEVLGVLQGLGYHKSDQEDPFIRSR
jgi:hypothetical protein